MEKHALHLSLIGGGIWRLPTVAALQCPGIGVMVFERNLELCEIGAGLTKWGLAPSSKWSDLTQSTRWRLNVSKL